MQSVLRGAQNAAERLTVRSALNPLLWLCGISVPTFLGAALTFDRSETLRGFCAPLVYVSLGLVIMVGLVGASLAFFRPDKLQSEEYQLRQQALLMFQQMGGSPQVIDPASIVARVKSTTPRR
jgi:hypothetical protein